VLVVDPAHGRQGHGSRLLAAAVDLLREDGFTHVFTWVPSTDDPLRRLLIESGWAADGARRTLGSDDEPGTQGATEAHQLRMLTDLRTT
jgi:ribosomal protein S18 acetylase RimI-like enzyme